MFKGKNFLFIVVCFVVPVAIYFYWLKWRTYALFGDDLIIYMQRPAIHGFKDLIGIGISFAKFRPTYSLVDNCMMLLFGKHTTGYYLFNVAIQAMNVFVFAAIANLFLRSRYLSILVGLMVGVSRFTFFNISQLLVGGALEGIAMTFFLLTLYFLLKVLYRDELGASEKQKGMVWSLLYANLAMYTHERYIVLFPFILLVILFFPGLKMLAPGQRIRLGCWTLLSIVLNVVIKKYVFSIPFFVGTGGTTIAFSLSTAFSYLRDGVLSILQLNSGPEYLAGISFLKLPFVDKLPVILVTGTILVTLTLYVARSGKKARQRQTDHSRLFLFFAMIILFGLLLGPAIVTIRLEQRWLQASQAVLVVLLLLALDGLHLRSQRMKNSLVLVFVALFLWTDHAYFYQGADNLYLVYSNKMANAFQQAINRGVIYPETKEICFWEQQRNANGEGGVTWVLAEGDFFTIYQGKPKKILYTDSVYERAHAASIQTFGDLKERHGQLLCLGRTEHAYIVSDLTSRYYKDSLKNFTGTVSDNPDLSPKTTYPQDHLVIKADDNDKFGMEGFYQAENSIRWTNGHAIINFWGKFNAADSLEIVLDTYMPPNCSQIKPTLVLTGYNKRAYKPIWTKRQGDRFIYRFYFDEPTQIDRIGILSDTISSHPPDIRVLSFPFKSLAIDKK